MVASFSRLLCGVALLQAFVASSPLPFDTVPRYFQKEPLTRRALSPLQVQKELGSTLSVNATIIGPNDPAFANVTRRWNYVAPPRIELAVQAGEEEDIAKIVRYCNDNSIKFLAVNRGHGFSGAYKQFKGVQIDLKQLQRITIHEDEQTATFQGGVWAPEIMHTLWDNGNYLTPTGSHACVGYLGPAMGGGHGRLEGLYGLVADNLLHLNVVLADGKTIQVNKTSHADLYWAIKGAGHNFGIVTHAKVKIYKSLNPTWHWHNYIWKQDKLEAVLTELNKIQDGGKAPRLLAGTFGQVLFNKSVSDTEPVLSWQFAYYGPAADAEKILRPFSEITAVWADQGDLPYPEIVYPQQTYLCPSGKWVISSAMTKTWNITAERRNYNNFVRNAASYPEFAATAQIVYQGYATAGMQDIDPDSTAYAHRDQYHTALLQGLVPEGQSVERAEAWAKEAVDEWMAGQPGAKLSTYPNYSVGAPYETLESIYGYEPWRLQRLRKLKAKYDPHNRFRYHVPVIPEKN